MLGLKILYYILENFMCSENYICTLFENKDDSYLKKISVRGNTMSLQF